MSGCAACVSPGPPVIEPRCVAHATGNTFSTCVALPSAIALAARYGAVPAHVIPPPHGDVQSSWLVPKCSWNASASKSGKAPLHVSPSTSDGIEAGIGDGPLRGFGPDVAGGAARGLRVGASPPHRRLRRGPRRRRARRRGPNPALSCAVNVTDSPFRSSRPVPMVDVPAPWVNDGSGTMGWSGRELVESDGRPESR